MNKIDIKFFHDLETRNNLLRISVNNEVIYNKENLVYCSPDCYEGLKLPFLIISGWTDKNMIKK